MARSPYTTQWSDRTVHGDYVRFLADGYDDAEARKRAELLARVDRLIDARQLMRRDAFAAIGVDLDLVLHDVPTSEIERIADALRDLSTPPPASDVDEWARRG